MKTGVKDLHSTKGNQEVYVLRRQGEGHAEFLLISLWGSLVEIEAFAGPDIESAVYYPEDKDFLLELESKVVHYDVLAGP